MHIHGKATRASFATSEKERVGRRGSEAGGLVSSTKREASSYEMKAG